MKQFRLTGLGVLATVATVAACGGGSAVPGTHSAANVQSNAMAGTFAGQNKCNAKNQERPFVIEWDATDMSSFESRAANDVIFVHYEGCDLKILDSCVNDSVKGSLGSYKPVDWTSGSLEALDINSQGELYAKLPLGAASLGGRVEGGEKFHMEYFVSGTRSATRDAVFKADVEKISGCKGATHFVYAYNLGAFALGAQSNMKGTVGGSAFGFGAGGSRSSESKADKQGGVLASCRAESAKDVQTCTVPIRLTLRELTDGQSADAKEALAPETPEAYNLAARLKATNDRERKAQGHAETAREKMVSRDGKGCVAELDKHDKLDPRPSGLSTNSASYYSVVRGQCLMLGGQCAVGKTVLRKTLEKTQGAMSTPEAIDGQVDGIAGMYCQGASMGGRDRILQASMALGSTKTAAVCNDHIKALKDLIPTTAPKDEDDHQVLGAPDILRSSGVACLAKAGDCQGAWALRQYTSAHPELWKYASADRRAQIAQGANMQQSILRAEFDMTTPKCRGQLDAVAAPPPPTVPTPPAAPSVEGIKAKYKADVAKCMRGEAVDGGSMVGGGTCKMLRKAAQTGDTSELPKGAKEMFQEVQSGK